MWPQRGEALSRTLEVESALADLYADALNSWVAVARKFVIPDLVGVVVNGDPAVLAAALPPNPDAVDEAAGPWNDLSTQVILAGLSSLWAISLVEASEGLEIELPSVPSGFVRPKVSSKVLRSITATSSVTAEEVREAVAIVEADDDLRMARDDFIASQREAVEVTPAIMREKVTAAVREVTLDAEPDITVAVLNTVQREAAVAVLTPGSEAVRDTARVQGYQAAGVQNAAVIEAAKRSGEDVLDKTWIATIDGKTRDTHFAADGQRTPLGGTFTVGNAALRFPGDPFGPPSEVKNCRCRVGVLAPDEEIPDEVDRHTERLNGRDSVQVNRSGTQRDEIDRRAADGVVRARDDERGIGRTAAAGGWTAPSEQEYDMPGQRVVNTEQGGSTVVLATDDGETSSETFRTFTDQPIAFIGVETSDGRMLAEGIELSVRTPPLPVMYCEQQAGGHYDSFTVGVTESARIDGDRIVGSGYWLNDERADSSFTAASHKVSRPSVDLAATEWILTVDGKEITEEEWWDLPADAHVVQTITKAELIGFTMVATPAFGETQIEFNGERETRDVAVVASAAAEFRPRVYPAAMFAAPNLAEPTEIHMTDDGRIIGHLACFGACHRSIQSACVIAPRSPSQYAQFHTSPSVALDDGTRVPVGRLTVGTGHAPDAVSGPVAMAHYDNTGACFALVRAYETSVGIEISGVAAPWATPEQIEMGLAAPLSGDWRDFGQGLDLIAALAVNTPGFAVRGRSDSLGRPAALVASLGPRPTGDRGSSGEALTADAIADIVARSVTAALAQRDTDAEVAGLLATAADKVGPPPPPAEPVDEVAELLARVR